MPQAGAAAERAAGAEPRDAVVAGQPAEVVVGLHAGAEPRRPVPPHGAAARPAWGAGRPAVAGAERTHAVAAPAQRRVPLDPEAAHVVRGAVAAFQAVRTA